jgi:hypothetical protein
MATCGTLGGKAINWYNLYSIYNLYNYKYTNKYTNKYYDIYNIYGKREAGRRRR